MIEENKDVLHELAAYLVERETITGKEFVRIYEEATGTKLKEDKKQRTGSGRNRKRRESRKWRRRWHTKYWCWMWTGR